MTLTLTDIVAELEAENAELREANAELREAAGYQIETIRNQRAMIIDLRARLRIVELLEQESARRSLLPYAVETLHEVTH